MRSMSGKNVIPLEDISSFQADTESVVRAAVPPSLFDVPEEKEILMSLKVFEEAGEDSPVGGPEGSIEVRGVCEWDAGTKAVVADVDVDVVGGVDEVGVSGYES